ncbi:MAG: glycosyltransferase family 39 protein [Alphaproteobacteria bacterium]|nr:glycosyltransferase family 39 protein [Alphaproteobacteria bacterium]MDE2336513.1 glycosyltransferase family 39 protein [Alphaproteobacteria bacterium]
MSFTARVFTAFSALLLVRVAGMLLIPLNETTEARYGEMARKMLVSGDWVTLWHKYGVPFWAKPPLYAWLSAASMGLFGADAFAARLPSLLLSVLMCWLVYDAARRRDGKTAGLTAALALASSTGFFVAGGTVMTDPSLVFCTMLVQLAFWHALHDEKNPRLWAWLFFTGCGLGLLSKGPVALVLPGLPVFFWVLIRKEWKALWQKLPWVRGTLLTFIIAAPWYLMAEHRTPGFLKYFIVGENISRFLDPHWKGDLYGFAHAYPYGAIWPIAFGGLFPWSLVALKWARTRLRSEDGWILYLVLWSIASLAFFTFCANIIWPYVLMMQPGFALLFAAYAAREETFVRKYVPLTALVTALLGAAAIFAFRYFPQKLANDQADIIKAWQATGPRPNSHLVFWSNRMEFSAEFYSGGRAFVTDDPRAAELLLTDGTRDCIITYTYNEKTLPRDVRKAFHEVARITNHRGTRILLCQ